MNLIKHLEFFDPTEIHDEIHIIGCGAIGSTIAEMLTRLGFNKLYLYDFDTVTEHNITNQMFRFKDIGRPKVEALEEILKEINPEINIVTKPKGYNNTTTRLAGVVFIAVDSIDLRNQIVDKHKYNKQIKFVIDCRMELVSAQMYAADWLKEDDIKRLKDSMAFTEEEAKAATPVSACGTSLSVTPTVRDIVSIAVANLINYYNKKPIKNIVINNPFTNNTMTYPV